MMLARKRASAGNAKKAMIPETMEGIPTLKSVINWTLNFSGVLSFDTLLLTSVAMRSMRENSLLSLLTREFRFVSFLPVSALILLLSEDDPRLTYIPGLEHWFGCDGVTNAFVDFESIRSEHPIRAAEMFTIICVCCLLSQSYYQDVIVMCLCWILFVVSLYFIRNNLDKY